MLSHFNNIHLDIYNRCIRPVDQSIDWPSFFIWAQLLGVENPVESADYILFMRQKINEDTTEIRSTEKVKENKKTDKKKSALEERLEQKNKNKNASNQNKVFTSDEIDSMLKKSGKYRA